MAPPFHYDRNGRGQWKTPDAATLKQVTSANAPPPIISTAGKLVRLAAPRCCHRTAKFDITLEIARQYGDAPDVTASTCAFTWFETRCGSTSQLDGWGDRLCGLSSKQISNKRRARQTPGVRDPSGPVVKLLPRSLKVAA